MSISVLEKFISAADKKTCMPAVSCLGSVIDNGSSVGHNWENAVDVDPTEMSCQVLLVFNVFCVLHYTYNLPPALFSINSSKSAPISVIFGMNS